MIAAATFIASEDGNDYIVEIRDEETVAFLDADAQTDEVLFTYTIASLADVAPGARLALDLGGGRYIDPIGMENIRKLARI